MAGWDTTELVGLLKVLSLGPGNATGLMGKFLEFQFEFKFPVIVTQKWIKFKQMTYCLARLVASDKEERISSSTPTSLAVLLAPTPVLSPASGKSESWMRVTDPLA